MSLKHICYETFITIIDDGSLHIINDINNHQRLNDYLETLTGANGFSAALCELQCAVFEELNDHTFHQREFKCLTVSIL